MHGCLLPTSSKALWVVMVLPGRPLGWRSGNSRAPLCDIPSVFGVATEPWTVARSSFRKVRWVVAACSVLRRAKTPEC